VLGMMSTGGNPEPGARVKLVWGVLIGAIAASLLLTGGVQALQTATIVPARMTGMDNRVGSIATGKTADIILVDGDVSRDLRNLRHVDTVFLDGYRLKGVELREASGLTGMPK